MTIRQFNFPTHIKFGSGAVKLTTDYLRNQGLKRPLIATDRALVSLPMITSMVEHLKSTGMQPAVYSGIYGNPTVSQVTAGVLAFRDHGADAIVIVGGGAVLDVGKAIGLMVNHPGHIFDYEDDKPDGLPVDQPIPYMIAVPTTSGTGSEVGRASVISDDVTHAKKIIFSPRMLCPVVLADPDLTIGLPAAVTAAVGFDALTHNIEAFLATGLHPICDGIALEGVVLAARHLEQAVHQPTNIEARGGMMLSSMMGAIAFQKGLGVTHSCAHALSTIYDTHHGLANALMLVACMEFNQSVVEDRLARLGQAVGVKSVDQKELASGFITWIESMKKTCGLPTGLGAVGVDKIEPLLDIAVSDPCHGSNPRKVTRADFQELFKKSM